MKAMNVHRVVLLTGAVVTIYYVLITVAVVGPIVIIYGISANSLNVLADATSAAHAYFLEIARKLKVSEGHVVASFLLAVSTYVAFIVGGTYLSLGRAWARKLLIVLLIWITICLVALELHVLPLYSYHLFGFYDWTIMIVHILILLALLSSAFRSALTKKRETAVPS